MNKSGMKVNIRRKSIEINGLCFFIYYFFNNIRNIEHLAWQLLLEYLFPPS